MGGLPLMEEKLAASRGVVKLLDREFQHLIAQLNALVTSTGSDLLHQRPQGLSVPTIGECILKSAAIAEQVFGGLTTNLWDDPFEWTLPEALSDRPRILEYLGEVDQARQRAFACFADDASLLKKVSVPSGEALPLAQVLLDALRRANIVYGQAQATHKIFSARSVSGYII
ncbi:MAG TPA: hypothetical protein VKB46_24525 [Pyrinomonadaceae bacterium]|nr:hypothetical protein [Pyrinomonadaceae bacterium]